MAGRTIQGIFPSVLCLSIWLVPAARCAEVVPILNKCDHRIELWIYKGEPLRWARMALNKGTTGEIELVTPGKYYLVARDDSGRDYRIGWIDFHSLVKKMPRFALDLATVVMVAPESGGGGGGGGGGQRSVSLNPLVQGFEDPEFKELISYRIEGLVHEKRASTEESTLVVDFQRDRNGERRISAKLPKLARVPEWASINSISFYETDITDEGLKYLASMNGLQSLSLWNTAISDAGLEHLAHFANLKQLDLSGTLITDAGVATLAKLKKLERIYLPKAVSDRAVETLRSALPDLKIYPDH